MRPAVYDHLEARLRRLESEAARLRRSFDGDDGRPLPERFPRLPTAAVRTLRASKA